MLLSIYYRKDCLKSQFLRAVIREMAWDIREYDVADPASAEKLAQLKQNLGSGQLPHTPAIHTTEAYSHDLLAILEYLHERNPSASMYPDDPSIRLFARTALYRTLRQLVPIWDACVQSKSTDELLRYYEESEPFVEHIVKAPKTYRSNPDMPNFLEILYAIMIIEIDQARQVSSKPIRTWLKSMVTRPSLSEVVTDIPKI